MDIFIRALNLAFLAQKNKDIFVEFALTCLAWKKTNLKERETTHDWDESASQYYLYH